MMDFSNPALDQVEQRFARQRNGLNKARLGVSTAALAFALAIAGCMGRVTTVYNNSKGASNWMLSPWPTQLDLSPSNGLIAVASVAALLNLLLIVLGVTVSYFYY
jgi:hypothetical protein